MYKKANPHKAYYFTEKLLKQLERIPHHPLTIVEAPSGFGKTTAVREFLNGITSSGANAYWYTCLGEPASIAWKGICELLSNANDEIAANMKKLKMPTMGTLLYMTAILKDFHCQWETYLVIDNYQLVDCDIPRELMSVFSMHRCPNLHMVFITQQLGNRQQLSIHNANIHLIHSSDFFFDKKGTANLFRMEGIHLSDSELDAVFSGTEGWVSAIRLQIINFAENGTFQHTADIEHLVEAAIWKRLTPVEKDFLLSVSIMDSFTTSQAAIMMNQKALPENIEETLKFNDFIRYHPDKDIFVMHSILRDYLRNRFYNYQPEDFQKRMLRLAGRSYAALTQYYPAAQFFYKVKDFDAILSIPFNGEYLGNQKENSLPEFIGMLVEECPEETLCKYPSVMLTFSAQMYICGQIDTYRKLNRLIRSAIDNNKDMGPEDIRQIEGQLAILQSYEAYNDIRQMNLFLKSAWEIVKKPFLYARYDTPFTLGCPSVLFMFWRESGELGTELKDLEETLPDYRRLASGHGTGADSIMRAEALLMRGEDDNAEILCHKALYAAQSNQQTSICLCAELVLARIAILRGDVEGYLTAVRNIQNYKEDNDSQYVLRMAELCMATISLTLGITDNVASWICDMEHIKKNLYAPVVPYAQTLYVMLLLNEKRYNKLLGLSQLILDMAESRAGNACYMMSRVYHLKCLAIAKLKSGNEKEAREYLNKALAIALPDKIYLPFAQQSRALDNLFEVAKGSTQDRPGLNALMELGRRQEKGVNIIKKAVLQAKSPLTPREREVAELARDRLRAVEIADRLYISEATVKTILKSVYSKLDVHSKFELGMKEF